MCFGRQGWPCRLEWNTDCLHPERPWSTGNRPGSRALFLPENVGEKVLPADTARDAVSETLTGLGPGRDQKAVLYACVSFALAQQPGACMDDSLPDS